MSVYRMPVFQVEDTKMKLKRISALLFIFIFLFASIGLFVASTYAEGVDVESTEEPEGDVVQTEEWVPELLDGYDTDPNEGGEEDPPVPVLPINAPEPTPVNLSVSYDAVVPQGGDKIHFIQTTDNNAGYVESLGADAILLESGGHFALIDVGPEPGLAYTSNGISCIDSNDSVVNYLRNYGVTALDFILITHWQKDSAGNIFNLIQKASDSGMVIGQIFARYWDDYGIAEISPSSVKNTAESYGIYAGTISDGEHLYVGNMDLRMFMAGDDVVTDTYAYDNITEDVNSIGVLVTVNGTKTFLASDINNFYRNENGENVSSASRINEYFGDEAYLAETNVNDPDFPLSNVAVMKLPNHGAEGSMSENYAITLNPLVCVLTGSDMLSAGQLSALQFTRNGGKYESDGGLLYRTSFANNGVIIDYSDGVKINSSYSNPSKLSNPIPSTPVVTEEWVDPNANVEVDGTGADMGGEQPEVPADPPQEVPVVETIPLSEIARDIVYGDEGADVAALIEALRSYGYYNGDSTNVYGDAVDIAVRTFQEQNGLYVDGIVGAQTLSLLMSGEVVSNPEVDYIFPEEPEPVSEEPEIILPDPEPVAEPEPEPAPLTVVIEFASDGAYLNTYGSQYFVVGTEGQSFLGTIERTGYDFIGWAETPNATEAMYGAHDAVSDEWIAYVADNSEQNHKVLYPVWQERAEEPVEEAPENTQNTVSVIFDGNGAETNTYGTQIYTYGKLGQSFLGEVFRTGYDMLGWSTIPNATTATYNANTGVDDALIDSLRSAGENVTLYAVWKARPVAQQKVSVIFDGNGANVNTFAVQTFTKGELGQAFTGVAQRVGYDMLGWSLVRDDVAPNFAANEAVSDAIIDSLIKEDGSDAVLYAVWQPKSVIVNFDSNGATSSTYEAQMFTYDVEGQTFEGEIQKDGQVFLGWGLAASDTSAKYGANAVVSNDFIDDVAVNHNGSITLYAVWQEAQEAGDSVTVTFSAEGADKNTFEPQTFTTAEAVQQFTGEATRKGYNLLGWATDQNATTADYAPNAKVSDKWVAKAAQLYKGALTLYAVWEPHSVNMTFDGNGATYNTFASQMFTYGQPNQTFTGSVSKEGAEILGWSTVKDDVEASYATNFKVTDDWLEEVYTKGGAKITLYAIWKQKPVTPQPQPQPQPTVTPTVTPSGTQPAVNPVTNQPVNPTTQQPETKPQEETQPEVHEPITATVEFDGNGATVNTFGKQTFIQGVPNQSFVGEITKDGANFIGWSEDKDNVTVALNKNYKVTDGWINGIHENKEGYVTLYAIWQDEKAEPTEYINAETIVKEEETTVAAEVDYQIVQGNGQNYKKKSTEEGITFVFNVPAGSIQELTIDGQKVSKTNYTIDEENDREFVLSSKYLDNLRIGRHTINFTFEDGEANALFVVTSPSGIEVKTEEEAETTAPAPEEVPEEELTEPETTTEAIEEPPEEKGPNIPLIAGIGAVVVGGGVGGGLYYKKKKNDGVHG